MLTRLLARQQSANFWKKLVRQGTAGGRLVGDLVREERRQLPCFTPACVSSCLPHQAGFSGRVDDVSPVCSSDPGMSNANMNVVVLAVSRVGGAGGLPGARVRSASL